MTRDSQYALSSGMRNGERSNDASEEEEDEEGENMNELAVFLRSLNLGHYTRAMLQQGLDFHLLETLNDYELQVRKANRGRNQNDERRRDSQS
eukprot:915232-Prorocentrum_minimum.AAC.1